MMVSALTSPVELSKHPTAARRQLLRLLDDASWGGDVDGVLLAVHEAMVNAQRHGGGVTGATAGIEGGRVVVEIADRGDGFALPDASGRSDLAAERGRGLFLIRSLAADARVVRSGDDVRLVLTFDN